MACEYADDAYLIARFPQVVITTPGAWLVMVAVVAAGNYTINVGGLPYVYAADGTETLTEIRDALLLLVSTSLAVASMPTGSASITLSQVQAAALTVTAAGPNDGDVTITQTGGTDNAAYRAAWLESAKCGVPDCWYFSAAGCGCSPLSTSCEGDYTLWHAALAAHMILLFQNMTPTGYSSSGFQTMRLGPATLTRGQIEGLSSEEQGLSQTAPGQLVIMLRRRYLPPVVCA